MPSLSGLGLQAVQRKIGSVAHAGLGTNTVTPDLTLVWREGQVSAQPMQGCRLT